MNYKHFYKIITGTVLGFVGLSYGIVYGNTTQTYYQLLQKNRQTIEPTLIMFAQSYNMGITEYYNHISNIIALSKSSYSENTQAILSAFKRIINEKNRNKYINIKLVNLSEKNTYNMQSNNIQYVSCDTKTLPQNTHYTITKNYQKGAYNLTINGKTHQCSSITVQASINTFTNHPNYKKRDTKKLHPDNQYRDTVIFTKEKNERIVSNKLTIKNYLKGMAEVLETTHEEKKKALALLTASYAKWFATTNYTHRYTHKPYQGTDSPESFQKYIGYGYEKRSPKRQKTIERLGDKAIYNTKNNELVKLPYFSCTMSKNKTTKLPHQLGRKETFYQKNKNIFKSVDDTIGIDPTKDTPYTCGHGVGMSGKGASELAKNGATYNEILNHYFNDIIIK